MKKSLCYFLALACMLIFFACEKDSEMTDDQLITAIQNATNKQSVTGDALPAATTEILINDYTESYIATAQFAPELGYEVSMRRGVGTRMGERSDVYFSLEGRQLRRERDVRGGDRGQDGRDREECFELVFPLTFIMPDGTAITGNTGEELRTAVSQWYDDNPTVMEEPSIQYPVDLIFEDGAMVTINSDEELRGVYARCEEANAGDFDCPRLRANVGDACWHTDRSEGTVSADCVCE